MPELLSQTSWYDSISELPISSKVVSGVQSTWIYFSLVKLPLVTGYIFKGSRLTVWSLLVSDQTPWPREFVADTLNTTWELNVKLIGSSRARSISTKQYSSWPWKIWMKDCIEVWISTVYYWIGTPLWWGSAQVNITPPDCESIVVISSSTWSGVVAARIMHVSENAIA
jgi:hypothetical protein